MPLGFSVIGGGALGASQDLSTPPITREVKVKLTNPNGTVANLTGIKWAWFDQTTPHTLQAPSDVGSNASTDSDGNLRIVLQASTLLVGDVGWLILSDSDGNPASIHKAFCGPVVIT